MTLKDVILTLTPCLCFPAAMRWTAFFRPSIAPWCFFCLRASQTRTEISETICQNNLFFLELVYFSYFASAMETWLIHYTPPWNIAHVVIRVRLEKEIWAHCVIRLRWMCNRYTEIATTILWNHLCAVGACGTFSKPESDMTARSLEG